ncbi:MAG: bifunctional (p)ppGpp synthetase/guanosine-3',5'-bis(diphosphate) 3'-pyrophosphohydrolase [Eubacterium sp.]|nr:bifunctional (p)ppGpp synthetase/guanosine-3',5'-bis(diphosphate) 3'-pyrophosphohydrolase [Eubacterium sp.]
MTDVFEKAVSFAARAHRGQKRKDGSIYILHPLEVAVIAGTMTHDEDVIAAAVLHDTVEDTDVTAQDILDNFGERIAELVAHETENKRPDLPPEHTWRIRKEESLAVLKDSPIESKMLWVSDKVSNMRSLVKDYEEVGAAVFERFNEKDPKEQRWYHRTVLDYTSELADTAAYKEYESLFNRVFDDYK